MIPTAAQLEAIAGFDTSDSNVNSTIYALQEFGKFYGLNVPHRLAHYLSHTAHESAGWRYDEEIASGRAYEGRADLGNVQPGDGVRYKGRTPIQITGRSNYRQFTQWCRKLVGKNTPDFEADPEAVNTDPWEGLAPIWFWSTRNLNALADENNVEQITKRINGGRNGLADRLERYTRAALVLLGYGPTEIGRFQRDSKAADVYAGKVDNDDGPKTRAALHMTLAAMSESPVIDVKPAPVVTVEERVTEVPIDKPVAVVPKGSDKRGWLWGPLSGISLGSIVPAFFDLSLGAKLTIAGVIIVLIALMLFLGERLIRRAKELRKAIEEA